MEKDRVQSLVVEKSRLLLQANEYKLLGKLHEAKPVFRRVAEIEEKIGGMLRDAGVDDWYINILSAASSWVHAGDLARACENYVLVLKEMPEVNLNEEILWLLTRDSLRQSEEKREKGYREMAARIAHMSSGSILLAQLRLSKVSKKEDATAEEFCGEIEEVLKDLKEAQQGLDRARLLGVPWQQYKETIQLGGFVAQIGHELNEATGQEVVKEEDLSNCESGTEIMASFARVRLTYAFRDLMLGTWILTRPTGPNRLRQAVRLSLSNRDRNARLHLLGGKPNLAPDVSSEQELENILHDPEVFLLSPDKYEPERSIGFQMAWVLIAEMDGSIHPALEEDRISFLVELPLTPKEG